MPIKGDIRENVAHHKRWINQATADEAELVIFPELSLTGYEPTLARKLAMDRDDARLDDLQTISDTNGISIGVGAPTKHEEGIRISMFIFRPHKERNAYSKTFLHADEEPFFVRGRSSPHLRVNQTTLALAICYEISVPEHLESALKSGPSIYVASVAKFTNGFGKSTERLSRIAADCSMPVLMANSVGLSDGKPCAGKTSVWNHHGLLIGQLNDSNEGMLIFDSETQEVTARG